MRVSMTAARSAAANSGLGARRPAVAAAPRAALLRPAPSAALLPSQPAAGDSSCWRTRSIHHSSSSSISTAASSDRSSCWWRTQQKRSVAAALPQPDRVDVRAASTSSSSTSTSSSSSSSDSSSSSSTTSSSSGSYQSASSSAGAVSGSQRPGGALRRHGITGDGSCMFRACVQGHHCAQHGGAPMPAQQEYEAALKLRADVVQALRDNREEMEPFLPGIADDFDGYLAQMSQPGVWGGEPELLMASRVLKRPISVYQATWAGPQHIVTYGEDLLKSAEPMHLLWSGAHYDLLLPAAPRSRL